MDQEQHAGFKLIGLQLPLPTTNEGGQSSKDCGKLWQQFEQEQLIARITGKLGTDIYAVYYNYEGDHTQTFSYFIGCKVSNDAVLPEGMDSLDIPSAHYIKVMAAGKMPDCVHNTWKIIWEANIDRSYQYDFEVYDERSKDWSYAAVDIYVSCNAIRA